MTVILGRNYSGAGLFFCWATPLLLILGLAGPAQAQVFGITQPVTEPTVLEVTTERLNLREGPNASSEAITTLIRGQMVCGIRSSGNWVRVIVLGIETNQSGWVSMRFVAEPNWVVPPAVAQRICPDGIEGLL